MRRRLLFSLIGIVVVSTIAFSTNLLAGNNPTLGLDLQGGVSVTLEPIGEYDSAAIDVAVEVIRQRVDSLGVAEPEIIRQDDTVVVNLPGVKEQKRALDLIGKTGEVLMRPVLQVGTPNPEGATTTTVAGATTTSVAGEAGGTASTVAGEAGGTSTSILGTTTSVAADTTSTPPTESGGLGSTRRPVRSATTIPVTTVAPETTVAATTIPQTTVATDTTAPATTVAAVAEATTESAVPLAAAPGDTTTTVVAPTDTTTPQVSVTNDPTQQAILEGSDGLVYFTGPAGATGEVFENDASAEIVNGGWVVNVSRTGAPAARVNSCSISLKCRCFGTL